MEKILSIIIPSYNMEDYLPKCLDSLLVNNIENLDILIVNDGSKDNTLAIARQYQGRFPESIRVIDKPNGNYGSCINRGLKEANGKYVKVLDADDSFCTDNFQRFIEFLKTTEADLVVSDYVFVDESGKVTRENQFRIVSEENSLKFDMCVRELSEEKFQMHAATYKKEILYRIQYTQMEGISYTDQQWMFTPMNEVNTVAFFPHVVYKYLVGRVGQTISTTNSYKNLNQTMKVVLTMLYSYKDMNGGKDESHRQYFEHRLLQKLPSIYRIALLKTDDESLRNQLLEFDIEFEGINDKLYHTIDRDQIGFMNLSYIQYWRAKARKGEKTPKLNILRKMVMRIFPVLD